MNKKKILVLGANGMLGNAIFLSLINSKKFIVKATIRDFKNFTYKEKKISKKILHNFKISNFNNIEKLIDKFKPNYLINCVGITNKKISINTKSEIFKINSILPQFLSNLSELKNFKFIHISTDCVFKGNESIYFENSFKSATDIYGLSKSLGEEVKSDSLIIRTSIIGHELKKKDGLLEWFLSQKTKVWGYDKVIYSGLTTVELARIIIKIIKRKHISGLYQVSSNKISKFELLNKIKKIYMLETKICKNVKKKKMLVLNSEKFKKKTNIKIKNWDKQISEMKKFFLRYQLPIKEKILK